MTDISNVKKLDNSAPKDSLWDVRPFQLVSLLEMLEHNANLFFLVTRYLYELQVMIEREINGRGGMSLLTDYEIRHTNNLIEDIRRACLSLQSGNVLNRLWRFNNVHFQPLRGAPFTLEQLRIELEILVDEIASALSQNKFMMIPTEKSAYYEQSELFGSEVAARFPKANKEITEAGNCYATGNNTACIFHLMRAAEHGLRELAAKLNVSFPKNPQKEIEFRMWSEVIAEVVKAINVKPNAKNQSEADELQIYNQAADQIQFFKDAWRDVIMHSREPRAYNEHDAMSAITSVKAFMKLIASLP